MALPRRWEQVAPRSGNPTLRVLQWNCLADGLAQDGQFANATPGVLQWNYRAPRLLAEIDAAEADIICLQEVNRFPDFFEPELTKRGYTGVFAEKSSSPCVHFGFPKDGQALFWRTSRLQAAGEKFAKSYVDAAGQTLSQGRLLQLLQDRATGAMLLAATTHLKAKAGAECEGVRVLESAQLAMDLRNAMSESNGTPLALLLCGDFNDDPTSRPVENLLADSQLSLRSALSDLSLPERFTTWKYRTSKDGSICEKRAIIDYVFYAPGAGASALRPVARWAPPTTKEIGPGALPSPQYPSDHLAVLVEFEWGAAAA